MRARVLLTEDNLAYSQLVRFELARADMDVVIAADGLEAFETLLKSDIDVLVTDYSMPRMNGAELCRKVRSNPHLDELPLLLATGEASHVDINQLHERVGLAGVLFKPFGPRVLHRAVRHCLYAFPSIRARHRGLWPLQVFPSCSYESPALPSGLTGGHTRHPVVAG